MEAGEEEEDGEDVCKLGRCVGGLRVGGVVQTRLNRNGGTTPSTQFFEKA